MPELIHTPLYEEHLALSGRMVPFAGHAMPVQYQDGALNEYKQVRDGGAGLFDISHMGQLRITGKQAFAFLQYVSTNDVRQLNHGQVQYSSLLNDQGTFIDDITIYKINDEHYYLCINAANRHKDVTHLHEQAKNFQVCVTDESDDTTLLALQGADAESMLQSLCDTALASIAYYRFAECRIAGHDVLVSRTGYTGEDGFELYFPHQYAVEIWRKLLAEGAKPIGLAARDMLRTEQGYALYGHEIHDQVTPVEAKLMWITKLDKGDFIGREAVLKRRQEGAQKRLIALRLTGRGIPREHYPVLCQGKIIGEVTSGMFSPMAGGLALAYVLPDDAERDDLSIGIRQKEVPAQRTKTPFVRSNCKKNKEKA